MLKTRCGDCKYYMPSRNEVTNRPLPSKIGVCAYPVDWPELPKAFLPQYGQYWGSMRNIQFPRRNGVWKDDSDPCAVFEEQR